MTNRNEDSEIHLVKAAIRGDDHAFEALMEKHQVYLYKVAFCHCKNEDMALDAVQECVTIAYLHIQKVHSPQYFRTWLTRILINTIRKEQKKAAKWAKLSLEDRQAPEEAIGVTTEERLDLYHAIDRLPEIYRLIIILKYFNDSKVSEIAQILEMPEGTVKGFLHRARGMLRADLEGGSTYESKRV